MENVSKKELLEYILQNIKYYEETKEKYYVYDQKTISELEGKYYAYVDMYHKIKNLF